MTAPICETCNGLGMVGGQIGQTAESFEQVTEACPDCTWLENEARVRCGDCRFFVRDGNCGFLATPKGRDRERPFTYAPFWVWSDCYSDREQVRSDVESCCSTFVAKATGEAGQ